MTTDAPLGLTLAGVPRQRRKGAGRKKSPNSGVSHLRRAEVSPKVPVHVTARVKGDVPRLKQPPVRKLFSACCKELDGRPGFRLLERSLEDDRIHLVIEAKDRATLSNGLNSLFTRFSKGLNKLFGRKGKVFAERYQDRT